MPFRIICYCAVSKKVIGAWDGVRVVLESSLERIERIHRAAVARRMAIFAGARAGRG